MAETKYTFTVEWDWDNSGNFPGPSSDNRITNGDFSSGETGWSYFGGAVHQVAGGKQEIYRNGGIAASFYQDFTYTVAPDDIFTVSFKIANTSAGDKDITVRIWNPDDAFGPLAKAINIPASTAEYTESFTLSSSTPGVWGTTTRFEIVIETDDNLAELTFDDISVTTTQSKNDITADVRTMQTQLGFTSPLDHTAAVGRAVLILDNASRNYSPDNSAGINYGKQWINAPIRIQVLYDGLVFPKTVWRGFTQSVSPIPGVYSDKTCMVTCDGIFGQWARAPISLQAQRDLTMAQVLNLIGAEVYKTDQASGTITFTAPGDAKGQITVGERTYTLAETVSTTAYEVLIGADVDTTARNLAAAINDNADAADGVQIYGDNTFTSREVSASVSGTVVTVTALMRGTLGNSIAMSTFAPHEDAATLTLNIGTHVAGTLQDTYTENQVYYQIAEFTGSPAFDLEFTFNMTGSGVTLFYIGRYEGNPAHIVNVDVYNGSTWDTLGTVPSSGSDSTLSFTLAAAHTIAGVVTMRFQHTSSGNTNHDLYVDHIYVTGDEPQVVNYITLSGAALTGGTDGPVGLTDYDTGKRAFDFSADRWSEDRTNAFRALQDVAESEFGYIWVARDGKITARDKDFEFELPALRTGVVAGEEAFAFTGEQGQFVFNRVTVSFQPRGLDDDQIIARANNTIAVPGKTNGTRWNRNVGYPNSEEAGALDAGVKLVRLPYVQSETGNIVGASEVITPRRGTDMFINDSRDLLGFDYTDYLPPFVTVSIVATGSGVECSFSNNALDTLYVSGFQVRGTAIISYDPQEIIRENGPSITKYQRRAYTYNIALPSGENYAEQIAYYLVRRYKDPEYRANQIIFRDARQTIGAGGGYPMAYDIGEDIGLTDAQTAVDHECYIRGITMDVNGMSNAEGPNVSIIWDVKRIDDTTYWILGDATYGVLGETTRPAL